MTASLGPHPITAVGLSPHLAPGRDVALDRVRGLACLLMLADHAAASAGIGSGPLRETVTRLAMPLFFLLAGHLARRPSWRHAELVAWGLVIPTVVPWVDAPNVLLWLGVLLPVVAVARRHSNLHLLLVVCLAALANPGSLGGLGAPMGTGYPPAALLALILLGALAPRSAFAWGRRLPVWVGVLGAVPLSFYVVHLVVLASLA